ncbi:hypothetical protein ZYGNAAKF_CDS0150 [Enterococcus phage VRE9_2]
MRVENKAIKKLIKEMDQSFEEFEKSMNYTLSATPLIQEIKEVMDQQKETQKSEKRSWRDWLKKLWH